MDEKAGSMEKFIATLDPTNMKTLFDLVRMSKRLKALTHPQSVKLDLTPVDLKCDELVTYLSWSR
jgi:hypothetical protein